MNRREFLRAASVVLGGAAFVGPLRWAALGERLAWSSGDEAGNQEAALGDECVMFVSLHAGEPGSPNSEISGAGYSRARAVLSKIRHRNGTGWVNTHEISFPECVDSWGEIKYIGVSLGIADPVIAYKQVSNPAFLLAGDSAAIQMGQAAFA